PAGPTRRVSDLLALVPKSGPDGDRGGPNREPTGDQGGSPRPRIGTEVADSGRRQDRMEGGSMLRFARENRATRPVRTLLAIVGLTIPIVAIPGLFSLTHGIRTLKGNTLPN